MTCAIGCTDKRVYSQSENRFNTATDRPTAYAQNDSPGAELERSLLPNPNA